MLVSILGILVWNLLKYGRKVLMCWASMFSTLRDNSICRNQIVLSHIFWGQFFKNLLHGHIDGQSFHFLFKIPSGILFSLQFVVVSELTWNLFSDPSQTCKIILINPSLFFISLLVLTVLVSCKSSNFLDEVPVVQNCSKYDRSGRKTGHSISNRIMFVV